MIFRSVLYSPLHMGNVYNTRGLKNCDLGGKGGLQKCCLCCHLCLRGSAAQRSGRVWKTPPGSKACLVLCSPRTWPGLCRHRAPVLHSHRLIFLPILGENRTFFWVISPSKSLSPVINYVSKQVNNLLGKYLQAQIRGLWLNVASWLEFGLFPSKELYFFKIYIKFVPL